MDKSVFFTNKAKIVLKSFIGLTIIYIQHIQLTYSASIGIRYCLAMDIRFQLLNTVIAAIPFLLIVMITGNVPLSLGISSISIFLLSIINYHVFLFHGTPFLGSDIYNIGTAINVLSSYHVVLDKELSQI